MANQNDLRVVKTQRALCNALMELLQTKRFDSITVQELCDTALVRRATFYKHFYDKYDFWNFFVRRTRREFMENYPDSEAGNSLRQYCLYWFKRSIDFFMSHKMIISSIVSSEDACILIDSFTDEIYENISAFLNESDKEYKASTTVIATFCSGGITALLRRWFLSGRAEFDESYLEEFDKLMSVFNVE